MAFPTSRAPHRGAVWPIGLIQIHPHQSGRVQSAALRPEQPSDARNEVAPPPNHSTVIKPTEANSCNRKRRLRNCYEKFAWNLMAGVANLHCGRFCLPPMPPAGITCQQQPHLGEPNDLQDACSRPQRPKLVPIGGGSMHLIPPSVTRRCLSLRQLPGVGEKVKQGGAAPIWLPPIEPVVLALTWQPSCSLKDKA